jgi:hypothetical protein
VLMNRAKVRSFIEFAIRVNLLAIHFVRP